MPQGETRFEWDANNRLVAAHTPAGERVAYTYDPLGRHIGKEVNGRKTRFCWDGDVLLSETASIQPTREYVYYPETFTPLAMSVNGHTLHYHNDSVGLPHDLYTGRGDLVWSARYGPFGEASKIADEVDNPLRLQGQYYDAETGLHYNRFRYFDPSIGRFISTDPLGLAAGPDLYEYAPNVWNWVDPFGLTYTNKPKPLSKWLKNRPDLLEEARRQWREEPHWYGINPDKTPVFFRPGEVSSMIRRKAGEYPGHHPHPLSLGGPEGQVLTMTGDTRIVKNPKHIEATNFYNNILDEIKNKLGV